jgi:Calpain family cysteine protease
VELRQQYPADATTTVESTTAAADGGSAAREVPEAYRRGPRDSGQGAADGMRSRPPDAPAVRDDVRRYDADAEFKRGVAKPPGYLPDDTGRLSPRSGAPGRPIELHHDERAPRAMPRPSEVREVHESDVPHAVVDRPAIRDPFDDRCPDRYGDPLANGDGTRIPCFSGQPTREQTTQGWAGDCGLIAALGSVAAHRPDDITSRVREETDGTYKVSLSEVQRTKFGAAPTGKSVELTVTSSLPVYDDDPGFPACAKAEIGTTWCAVIEKALAGVDQTWTSERQMAWEDDWEGVCAQDVLDKKDNPRSGPAPDGYVRLHQGTSTWERAEVLTQLTGQEAEVREFPTGRDEWLINRIIRAQLADSKPVLVCSRDRLHDDEVLPHDLEAAHVYEVTKVDKGRIVLRNPWNHGHPEPLETEEFARNMHALYTTLM